MAGSMRPAGDFRTTYKADRTIFPTRGSLIAFSLGLVLLCLLPLQIGGQSLVASYWLALIIQIAIYAIAALGLNILVGFTGQISLGHAAFFGFGAFMSAYLSGKHGVPVALGVPCLEAMLSTSGTAYAADAKPLMWGYSRAAGRPKPQIAHTHRAAIVAPTGVGDAYTGLGIGGFGPGDGRPRQRGVARRAVCARLFSLHGRRRLSLHGRIFLFCVPYNLSPFGFVNDFDIELARPLEIAPSTRPSDDQICLCAN